MRMKCTQHCHDGQMLVGDGQDSGHAMRSTESRVQHYEHNSSAPSNAERTILNPARSSHCASHYFLPVFFL